MGTLLMGGGGGGEAKEKDNVGEGPLSIREDLS